MSHQAFAVLVTARPARGPHAIVPREVCLHLLQRNAFGLRHLRHHPHHLHALQAETGQHRGQPSCQVRQALRKDEQVLTVMKQKKAKICAGEKSSTASGKTSVSIAAQSQCVPEPSD